jgi:flagella basal body P-ring formation protein FlgA
VVDLSRLLSASALLALALPVAVAHAAPADAELLSVSSLADLQAQVRTMVQRRAEASTAHVQLDEAGRWGLSGPLPDKVWVSVSETALNAHTRQVQAQVRPSSQDAGPALGSLRFVLRALQPVWVSSLPLRKGVSVGCDQLRQEWRVALSEAPPRWNGDCEGLKALRVKRAIEAGDALLLSDLAPLAAVSANDEANASVHVGAVRIEVRATVLADGQVGQEIPIRLAGQSGVLKARVQAPGEVVVIKGL